MENLNLTPNQKEALLRLAGQKLGKSPQDIERQYEQGGLSNVISGLDPQVQSKINAFASDPKALEALLKNNKLAALLAAFNAGK